jgi:hypothetical protein
MDEFIVQFHGFSPSPYAQTYVRELMEKLYEQAPASASMRVMFNKKSRHTFKGMVRISSQAGSFYANAVGSGLFEVSQELFDRVHRQLDRWKTLRFSHDSIRKMPSEVFRRRLYEGKPTG